MSIVQCSSVQSCVGTCNLPVIPIPDYGLACSNAGISFIPTVSSIIVEEERERRY